MDVGPGQDHRERQAVAVDEEVALGAEASSVYGVGTGLLAPFFAGTLAESNGGFLVTVGRAHQAWACCGAGIAPSCRIMPIMSSCPRNSTIFPPTIR